MDDHYANISTLPYLKFFPIKKLKKKKGSEKRITGELWSMYLSSPLSMARWGFLGSNAALWSARCRHCPWQSCCCWRWIWGGLDAVEGLWTSREPCFRLISSKLCKAGATLPKDLPELPLLQLLVGAQVTLFTSLIFRKFRLKKSQLFMKKDEKSLPWSLLTLIQKNMWTPWQAYPCWKGIWKTGVTFEEY